MRFVHWKDAAAKARLKETTPCLALSPIYLKHLQKPDLGIKYAQQAMDIAPRNFVVHETLWEIYQPRADDPRGAAFAEGG